MRYIFTLLMLVSCFSVFSQEYREYYDSTGYYLVQYEINPTGVMIMPMVGYAEGTENPNKPHYDATVTVYEIKQRPIKTKFTTKLVATMPAIDTVLIGTSFKGQYVEGGCFEDRPEDMVNHAKKLQSEMTKPKKPTR